MTDKIDFDKIKEGDEVWVRGTWIGACPGDRDLRVVINGFGVAVPCSSIVKHVPQPWVPGDVVRYTGGVNEFTILAIDEDVAWIKRVGCRTHAPLSDLTFIRKGGPTP